MHLDSSRRNRSITQCIQDCSTQWNFTSHCKELTHESASTSVCS